MPNPKAWSFLTIDGYRHYGGNTGYADDPERIYRYDSNVPNHKRVKVGDIVIVRSRASVLGVSRIDQIVSQNGFKERQRCPECGSSDIKLRRTLTPKWWCRKGHLFDDALVESVPVQKIEARYGDSFRANNGSLSISKIRAATLRPSDQMSIVELDLAELEPYVVGLGKPGAALIQDFASAITELPATENVHPDPAVSIIQDRLRILREITVRRGQPAFRRRLCRRYGIRCLVTGCSIPGLIEAAHIVPYGASSDNSVTNGLLLRSDVHTLFDLGLLAIEPVTLVVRLAPEVMSAGYESLSGQKLKVEPGRVPSREALAIRWSAFADRLDGLTPTTKSPA
jgi:predicted restriction endonuclease